MNIKNMLSLILLVTALSSMQIGVSLASPTLENVTFNKGRVEMFAVDKEQVTLLSIERVRYKTLMAELKESHQHNIEMILTKEVKE